MVISRINKALYKYYFLTWVCVLILFKRRVPKWMQNKAKEIIEPEVLIGGKIEKISR